MAKESADKGTRTKEALSLKTGAKEVTINFTISAFIK
jgi:hypothetical protein